ncbi:MAG: hypothetical protein ACOCWM_01565 [Cyclobacteriaceae bacterium]
MINIEPSIDISVERYKNCYCTFVNSLCIDESIKNIVASKSVIDENPEFYLYYPRLFLIDQDKSSSDLEMLCIAGYLYYQATLLLDAVIDSKDTDKLLPAMVCQEEAIKLLTDVFGRKSDYWELWNQRRIQYFRAIRMEKELLTAKKVTIRSYGKVASQKSAFGKAAIDAMFILDKSKYHNFYNSLIRSHDLFSVAFQLNDDVLDFTQDFDSKQFNWALYKVLNLNTEEKVDIVKLKKLFYIDGQAREIFNQAILFLDRALEAVKDIPVLAWKYELEKLKRKFQNSIFEIDNYLEILNAKVQLSTKICEPLDLTGRIEKTIQFIKDKQTPSGSWREYKNQGGISDIWSTAFISSFLSEHSMIKMKLKNNLQKAMSFLARSKKNELWSYNSRWLDDADTTNFILLSYFFNGLKTNKKVLSSWASYFIKQKGFVTYKDTQDLLIALSDPKVSDVSGWVNVHQCVSAVSLYYLSISKQDKEILNQLVAKFDHLLDHNQIGAYWWTSEIYTYYFLVKSYAVLGKVTQRDIILKSLVNFQNQSGAFEDYTGVNLFFSGMALEMLLMDYQTYKDVIKKTFDFLITNQYEDGSWQNSDSLRVPAPDEQRPDASCYRAQEFNRLFTSTVILKSLVKYGETVANS